MTEGVSREGLELVALGMAQFGVVDAQRMAVKLRGTLGVVVDWHDCSSVLDSLSNAGRLVRDHIDNGGRTFYKAR